MRFFTPELYSRFNSDDDAVANQADEDWETAVLEYQKHLNTVRNRLPSSVRELADLDIHDAELIAFDKALEPHFFSFPFGPKGRYPYWFSTAIVPIKRNDEILLIVYVLWDRIRLYPAVDDWRFSKHSIHWLYDELEIASNEIGEFLHRVLLSDGRVIEIPFASAVVHRLPMQHTSGESVRHSA